jgi:aldose 1-epimerase
MIRIPLAAVALALGALAVPAAPATGKANVTSKPFGKTQDGTPVELYTLTNAHGMEVDIMSYGGIVVSLKVPDRGGKMADVVLGFDSLDGYTHTPPPPYFGALIGRYGNRIAKGKFTLDGHTYQLPVNDGANSLHGGTRGFDKHVWDGKIVKASDGQAVEFHRVSKDGEEGYPGNLDVTVRYTLTDANELKISYSATTDKDTVLNLTNHSYFNLKGRGEGDILDHVVQIHASKFTPTDAGLIPTGELKPVAGTPFDFNKPTAIGARINDDNEQLKLGKGYDHNFVLDGPAGTLRTAAEVYAPSTGRVMQVSTTEPGLQFYTGNFLDGTIKGPGGKTYGKRSAFCMETQHFPDSPNHPKFPTTELKPGQKYHTETVYKFSTR